MSRFAHSVALAPRMAILAGAVGIALAGVPLAASTVQADPGQELWRWRTHLTSALASDVEFSPTGQLLLVGSAYREAHSESNFDFLVQLMNRRGETVWRRFFNVQRARRDTAVDSVFGTTGSRLYVTGYTQGVHHPADWATVAYRADGTQLWKHQFAGAGEGNDQPSAITVSPTTGRIFVTGNARRDPLGGDQRHITTIAYAPNGDRLWTRYYSVPSRKSPDEAVDVLVPEGGRRLYVVGTVAVPDFGRAVAVIAYRDDGSVIWDRLYDSPDTTADVAAAAQLEADGRHLYVVGTSDDGDNSSFVTLKFRRDGEQIWNTTYDVTTKEVATELVITPDEESVIVAGRSFSTTGVDALTVGYSAAGIQQWIANYDRTQKPGPLLAASPTRSQFYTVAGEDSFDTIAYSLTGDMKWTQIETWSDKGSQPYDVEVQPSGSMVVVIGSMEVNRRQQAAAIAYATR